MHAKIDRADCMFLISNERLRRFQELIEELDFFTFILPFVKDSYQRSATILDIWYLISTKEISRIENPENTMIYPYRWYYLKIVESFQIKRYIQLALYDNDRLAFICAVHMYKELDEFITNKMAVNEEVENNYKILQQYNGKSIRSYYRGNRGCWSAAYHG